jgi:hypothetical protein
MEINKLIKELERLRINELEEFTLAETKNSKILKEAIRYLSNELIDK